MLNLIKTRQKALKGDSYDDENDALYEIVTTFETLKPEDKRKSKRPEAKSP